jgi:tetratricopeptide (TPR) repeat protein
MGSLEQDYTTVPGQLYACISLVGPDCPQKNDKFGLKIRGCFNSRDEAAGHARRLQKEDATFDIYVVDLYKWLLIPPDRDHIDDVHYNDDKLEELMSKYRENQAMASKMFEERKRDMMAKPTGSDMPYIKPGDENSKYYTKPDEPPISHPADLIERLQKEAPDAPIEELVKEADRIVATEIEERQKARNVNLNTITESEPTPEPAVESESDTDTSTITLGLVFEIERQKGNTQFRHGDFMAAVERYTAAIEDVCDSTPVQDHAACWSNRSACFVELGQYQAALSDADKAIELSPEWEKGWFRRGVAFKRMNNVAAAEAAFEQARVLKIVVDTTQPAETVNEEAKKRVEAVFPGQKSDTLRARLADDNRKKSTESEGKNKVGNMFSKIFGA